MTDVVCMTPMPHDRDGGTVCSNVRSSSGEAHNIWLTSVLQPRPHPQSSAQDQIRGTRGDLEPARGGACGESYGEQRKLIQGRKGQGHLYQHVDGRAHLES